MKANRIYRYGAPCVISFEETELPAPTSGEVLLQVRASGVGLWDAKIRTGEFRKKHDFPMTLGAEVSGVVVDVGRDVLDYRIGDEVFGITNSDFTGANAEYAVASAELLALKPRRIGFVEAAAVPIVAVAAWQMLFDHARLAPGQTVLILGAAGNIGSFAVQLGRLIRARVIAIARKADAPYLFELDADEVLDFVELLLGNIGVRVDAVIDTVGGELQTPALAAIRPGGVFVSCVSEVVSSAAEKRNVRSMLSSVNVGIDILDRIANLLDGGDVEVRIGAMLPVSQALLAHEMISGTRSKPRGRIVLRSE